VRLLLLLVAASFCLCLNMNDFGNAEGSFEHSSNMISTSAQVDIPAASIDYLGRTMPGSGGRVHFDWSQIEISTNFTGTGISAIFDDNTGNTYNAFVDNKLVTIINTTGLITVYPIATNLPNGVHSVLLTKRSEAFFGVVTFVGFQVKNNRNEHKPVISKPKRQQSNRKIEFIGDSITCGYGVEGHVPCSFSISTENDDVTYGPITANHFGAEVFVECWSGKGMVRNYGDPNITSKDPFPIYYPRTLANDASSSWNFNWVPDAVVINLGTNDYSTNPQPPQNVFTNGYNNFLNFIWSKYGKSIKLFLVCGPLIGNPCCQYVQAIVSQHSGQGVNYVNLQNILTYPQDYGCDGHPNVSGHAKMAANTIPIIKSVMGW